MSAMLLASLIGAGLSAASTGIGASEAAKERKKAENLQKKRENEAKMYYDTEYNKDYFDTASAKGMMNRASLKMREFGKQNQNSAIKTGATQENKIANAESANANYSNLLSKLADQGTQYKQNIRQQYLGQQNNFDNMTNNRIENNAQSKANAGANIGKAIGGVTQAVIAGADQAATAGAGLKSTEASTIPQAGEPIMQDDNLDIYNDRYNTTNKIIGGIS